MLGGDVFDQEVPGHAAAFDERLIHGEDIGIDLRLVGNERAGGVQNSRIDLPASAGLELIGAGEIEDAVVAFIPLFETTAEVSLRCPGVQTHEGVGEVVLFEVVLRREVVGFGLAVLAYKRGLLVALVQVVRNGAEVIEELAKQIPAAILLHHGRAQEAISGGFDGLFEQGFFATELDVTQALIMARLKGRWRLWWWRRTSVRRCRRDARPERKVARVELEASAGHEECARNPAGGEADNAVAGGQCVER